MGEGHIQKFISSARTRLSLGIFVAGSSLLAGFWIFDSILAWDSLLMLVALAISWLLIATLAGWILGGHLTKPTKYIAQAVMHITPSEQRLPPPNIDELDFGKELAESVTRQIYSSATVAQAADSQAQNSPVNLLDQLPVAVIGLAENNVVTLANSKATTTINQENFVGQPLQDTLSFLTEDEITLESWLESVSQKSLTDFKKWQKVAVKTVNDESLGYFDIAVSYNKHSASGLEAIIVLYDHSEAYSEEESSISFVSLAVHEMRTPLTIMRGYMEAFEDELGPNANPQILDDLQKMNVSADTLTSFVSNILNVARINQGQLSLNLHEGNWNKVLPQTIDNLRPRAEAYGKTIELRMQPDMPTVAIDRMTINEVVTNLIDNAIKYSPEDAKVIKVMSLPNREGQIETTVQDSGVGIPASVVPHLFSKFYRNHRTRASVGGTGLGLYLSKVIITGHHGNIWASSKENQGSTFGFTLIPFASLAKELQTNNNESIVRSSHGWIKNHSMQRR
jgi:signal transduction histidine kinase